MADWTKVVPGRLEKTLDELRKLTRTGHKDYEPIPAEHAEEMLNLVQEAIDKLYAAYRPYATVPTASGLPAAATPVAPVPAAPAVPVNQEKKEPASPLKDPRAISAFVGQIQKQHLGNWVMEIAERLRDEWEEIAKRS